MKKYNGNKEPYIYAVYADNDREKALEILERINENGAKLTFEEKNAKDCIARSSLVLCFISNAVLTDKAFLEDIGEADLKKKTIVTLYLEETKLSPGLSMILNSTQGIKKYKFENDEDFYKALINTKALFELKLSKQQEDASKKPLFSGMIGGGVIAAILLVLLISGVFSNISPNSTLGQIGLSGNMNDITEVYLYGDSMAQDEYVVPVICGNTNDDTNVLNYSVVFFGQEYSFGKLNDVTPFGSLKNVEKLCLCGNEITDINPLTKLSRVKLLDLSGNHGLDISCISKMQSLEILNLNDTNVSDYSELLKLKNLQTVYVSESDLKKVTDLAKGQFDVLTAQREVTTYEQLKSALNDEGVMGVLVHGTFDIPQGETVHIKEGVQFLRADVKYQDFDVKNYGEIIVEGSWEIGLSLFANYGSFRIKNGGTFNGGMCDTINYGDFTIDEGATVYLERAQQFTTYGGTFTNNGTIIFRAHARLTFNSGDVTNNGDIYYNNVFNGGVTLNCNSDKFKGRFFANTVENEDEPQYKEVSFSELENYVKILF